MCSRYVFVSIELLKAGSVGMRVFVWYSEPIDSAEVLGGRMHATRDNVLLYAGDVTPIG